MVVHGSDGLKPHRRINIHSLSHKASYWFCTTKTYSKLLLTETCCSLVQARWLHLHLKQVEPNEFTPTTQYVWNELLMRHDLLWTDFQRGITADSQSAQILTFLEHVHVWEKGPQVYFRKRRIRRVGRGDWHQTHPRPRLVTRSKVVLMISLRQVLTGGWGVNCVYLYVHTLTHTHSHKDGHVHAWTYRHL